MPAEYLRPSKPTYYLAFAETAARRSTCLKRRYGAVIVKDDHIIATGYNGAPRGRTNCLEIGCPRLNIPNNTEYSTCRSVHAEANAMLHADYTDMIGSTLYLYGHDVVKNERVKECEPCPMCKRLIINAQIKDVVVYDRDMNVKTFHVKDWTLPCNDDSIPEKEPETLDGFINRIRDDAAVPTTNTSENTLNVALMSDNESSNSETIKFLDASKRLEELIEKDPQTQITDVDTLMRCYTLYRDSLRFAVSHTNMPLALTELCICFQAGYGHMGNANPTAVSNFMLDYAGKTVTAYIDTCVRNALYKCPRFECINNKLSFTYHGRWGEINKTIDATTYKYLLSATRIRRALLHAGFLETTDNLLLKLQRYLKERYAFHDSPPWQPCTQYPIY